MLSSALIASSLKATLSQASDSCVTSQIHMQTTQTSKFCGEKPLLQQGGKNLFTSVNSASSELQIVLLC